MKTDKIILITVAMCCAAPPLWAQSKIDTQTTRDRDEASAQNLKPFGDLRRSSQIIGEEITDMHDQRLGKVKDLALDLQNGRIAEVIVATGGVLGMDERIVAVPPGSFVCDRTTHALRFKGSQEELKNAEEFKLTEWNQSIGVARLSETYQQFGAETYFFVKGQTAPNPDQHGQVSHSYTFDGQNALPRVGYIARASSLFGTTARNLQDEKLGTVNSMVMDLPAGRVVEVIVAEGGFLGMDRELRAVPPQAFRWNVDNTAMTLDVTKETFRASPHFSANQWGYAYEPESIKTVYRTYNVQPYFIPAASETGAQNVRERTDDGVTALERGNSEDVNTSDHIRQAIQSNGALSADVGNVKIITSDGKVTLRGTVPTESEKQMIADTAAKFVSADRVSNQIEVKPAQPAVDNDK